MVGLYKQGGGLDSHRFGTITELPDKTITTQRHCFDYRHQGRRLVALEQYMLAWANPWRSGVTFRTDMRNVLPIGSRSVYKQVVRAGAYTTMFEAEGGDIMMGPFFGRRSSLKDKIIDYVHGLEDYPDLPFSVIGQGFWKVIENNGDLPALFLIWDELFEEEIKYEMLKLDPYCFD